MMTETFRIVLNRFQEQYPKRQIKTLGTIVYIDGEEKFNIDGYNDLYNITRLCNCLENELL